MRTHARIRTIGIEANNGRQATITDDQGRLQISCLEGLHSATEVSYGVCTVLSDAECMK